MFEPVRGGTRGGQAEFKWSDVSQDKDREVWFQTTTFMRTRPLITVFFQKNYLGHSINAPTGRWQKNKDIHWYQRDGPQTEDERREELRKIKEAESEALAAALCVIPISFFFVTPLLTPCQGIRSRGQVRPRYVWRRLNGGQRHCSPRQDRRLP